MKLITTWLLLLVSVIGANAQELNILPTMAPAGGSHNDFIDVTCTFPEGCAGGTYWFNGGQINARKYTGPIHIEHSTKLSIAGTNSEGRIITDIVTYDFNINKVTPPYVTTDPEIGTARESFYVTKIIWNNASSTALDIQDFKEGGSRHGEKVVWLVYEPTKEELCSGDYNSIWANGTDSYKAYVYKNYRPTAEGEYTLHIANGVFVIDGQKYNEELVLHYYIGQEVITAPQFSPAAGTYQDEVTINIEYPEKAFYQFYKINDGSTNIYSGPFTLNETATVKAWGRSEDYSEETETATATYVITKSQQAVVLPRPAFIRSGNTITITESEPATIKYWMNDKMQTACLYNGPFEVTENCKISAVAYTEEGISPTVDYKVNDFPVEDTDLGNLIIRTPEDWETLTMTGISPNGQYACGYVTVSGTPMSFVWNLSANKAEFISTQYNSYVTSISNNGTVSGWRVEVDPVTGAVTSETEEDLFHGYWYDGSWTRQPERMTVEGITGDNKLFGSYNGKPAVYDIATSTMTTYNGSGSIKCASADNSVFAGYTKVGGKKVATYWTEPDKSTTISTERECEVKAISGNGEWMYLDNSEWGAYCAIAGYRHNRVNELTEVITSNGAAYPTRYEWLSTITNDGTAFGVYDSSLQSHDAGIGLAYTVDGVWKKTTDILSDKGIELEGVNIYSSKYVTANQDCFVLTAFEKGIAADEGFTFGLAVKVNTMVKHAAPTALKAKQMYGIKTVKLNWENPLSGAEDIASFRVLRNGEQIGEVDSDTFYFYDKDVADETTYTYTIIAVYEDGIVSEPSNPSSITVKLAMHSPATKLSLRQSGINDVNLSWIPPVVALPKLQYFNEESEFAAFGTSGYSSEWAIRIPSSDISVYEGLDIHTFQFLPTGPQNGYEIRLYEGETGSNNYDAAPFYTQSIDPVTLKYGAVNTIELNEVQSLPEGKDLIVAIYIDGANDNMLGISHEGFRAGYTDLCRVEGVHNRFVSIAEESSETTEVVIPLGVGLATQEYIESAIVSDYLLSDNDVVIANTDNLKYRIEDVDEGMHHYAVRAHYQDGEYSDEVTLDYDLKNNEKAYVEVDGVNIVVNANNTASITWDTPLNDDRKEIHWGDMTPSPGMVNHNYPVFSVGSIYPVTMTNTFADEYEITHLYYYPTAEGDFRLFFDDYEEEVFFDETFTPQVNKFNFVELPEPITIDQSTNYRFIIDIDGCPDGEAPMAFDSSNKGSDWYSNLVNAGNDWMTLSDVVQINENPSWLMGIVIRQKDAREMPLEGYNIILDGEKCNAEIVPESKFTTDVLNEGHHSVSIDVVYDSDHTTKGSAKYFVITTDGIQSVDADSFEQKKYDIEGRRIISDKSGNKLFIIGNKKYLKK